MTYYRLLEAANQLKNTGRPADVARLLNISEQVMTNWKSRGIPADKITKVAKTIGCRPYWLEDGDGEMLDVTYNLSNQQSHVLKAMQNMDEYQQTVLTKITNSLVEPEKPNGTK